MYRAWQFLHPDLDAPEAYAGLELSSTGGVSMVDGAQSVRQAILLLLSTLPGERVMRPTYGCDLHKLIFSPNDGTTAGLAIHYVREALVRWEPRIELLSVDANQDPEDPGRLEIVIEYRLRASRELGHVEVSLGLTGATG
jgi:phage baseplate assembly protein W